MFSWLDFSIKDIIDILLMATFLYYTFVTLRNSGSRSLFMGIIAFLVLWLVISQVLQMRFRDRASEERAEAEYIAPVVLACMNMARKKTGALIAVQGLSDLTPYQHAGERFLANVNARLIETIFFKNSPLHDGAMIIAGGKICAAGCILPVASNTDLNKDLGLRHRSALGLSQQTDAKVIIISEERGAISLAYRGEIFVDITPDELREYLTDAN